MDLMHLGTIVKMEASKEEKWREISIFMGKTRRKVRIK